MQIVKGALVLGAHSLPPGPCSSFNLLSQPRTKGGLAGAGHSPFNHTVMGLITAWGLFQ